MTNGRAPPSVVCFVNQLLPPDTRWESVGGELWTDERKEAERGQQREVAFEGGIRQKPGNSYRAPEFLWVRHVTQELDSGKASAAVQWGNEKK